MSAFVLTEVVLPEPRPATVWITRDQDPDNGLLEEVLDLWIARPDRRLFVDENTGETIGSCWLAAENDNVSIAEAMDHVHVGRYTMEAIEKRFGTIPDDSRQCVRVECNT